MADALQHDELDSPASSSAVTTATPTVAVAVAAGESESENPSVVQTPVTSDADIAAALLGEVLSKVWSSSDTNLRTKKILDAVLRLEIDAVEGKKALPDSAPAADYRVVMLCVVMWAFMFLLVSARGLGGRDSAIDPPPT